MDLCAENRQKIYNEQQNSHHDTFNQLNQFQSKILDFKEKNLSLSNNFAKIVLE